MPRALNCYLYAFVLDARVPRVPHVSRVSGDVVAAPLLRDPRISGECYLCANSNSASPGILLI